MKTPDKVKISTILCDFVVGLIVGAILFGTLLYFRYGQWWHVRTTPVKIELNEK